MCYAKSAILFDFEIAEGTDHPMELVPDFNDKGKTASLLLCLTKSVHHTGRYDVLNSGFCILQALVKLKKFRVYAGALIKKRGYWPSLVPGEAIDE